MRLAAALLLAIVSAASADAPVVSASLLASMAQRLDARLSRMMPDDPVMPIGITQGTYIRGYGAVFMASLNLAPMAGISPFHQTIGKEELLRIHQKKLDRMPKLRELVSDSVLNLASSMDPVPGNEEIAVAVLLFYFNGENTSGLPSQLVMHGQRRALLDAKVNRALLASALHTEEF